MFDQLVHSLNAPFVSPLLAHKREHSFFDSLIDPTSVFGLTNLSERETYAVGFSTYQPFQNVGGTGTFLPRTIVRRSDF